MCFVSVRFVALIISSIATETLTAGPGRTRSVGHIFHAIAHLIKACAKAAGNDRLAKAVISLSLVASPIVVRFPYGEDS